MRSGGNRDLPQRFSDIHERGTQCDIITRIPAVVESPVVVACTQPSCVSTSGCPQACTHVRVSTCPLSRRHPYRRPSKLLHADLVSAPKKSRLREIFTPPPFPPGLDLHYMNSKIHYSDCTLSNGSVQNL